MRLFFVLFAGGLMVFCLYNGFGVYRSVRAAETSLQELRVRSQQDESRLKSLQSLPCTRPQDLSEAHERLTLFLQDLTRAEGVSVFLQIISLGSVSGNSSESADGLDSSRLQVSLGAVRDRAMLGRVLAAISERMRSGLFELEEFKQTKDVLTLVIVVKGEQVKG